MMFFESPAEYPTSSWIFAETSFSTNVQMKVQHPAGNSPKTVDCKSPTEYPISSWILAENSCFSNFQLYVQRPAGDSQKQYFKCVFYLKSNLQLELHRNPFYFESPTEYPTSSWKFAKAYLLNIQPNLQYLTSYVQLDI